MSNTLVKDPATATQAALSLDRKVSQDPPKPGETPAPRPKGTTETLFPEFVHDGVIMARPLPTDVTPNPAVPPSTPSGQSPSKAPDPASQTPPPASTTPKVYLSPEEMAGKLVKIKVDGVETEVPAESLLKSQQLEKHLNTQIETNARILKDLQRREAELTRAPTPPIPLAVVDPSKPPDPLKPPVKVSPELKAIQDQVQELTRTLVDLQATVLPQRYENGITELAARARTELGADDFTAYVPQIRAFVDAEVAKPEVSANKEHLKILDSKEFWYGKYKEMKLKDMLAGKTPPAAAPSTTPPAARTVPPPGTAPVIVDNRGNPVSMPSIEGGGGTSSQPPARSQAVERAQQLFEVARNSNGSTEAWMAYLKAKNEIPD